MRRFCWGLGVKSSTYAKIRLLLLGKTVNKKIVTLTLLLIGLLAFTGCLDELTTEKKPEKKLLVGKADEQFHKRSQECFTEANYTGALHYDLKQLEEDLKYYKEQSAEIAVDYNDIGLDYDKLKDYNSSVLYYKKAIKIDNLVLKLTNPEKATTYYNLASSYDSLKRYDKALNYYLKSLSIKQKLEYKLITYQDIAKIYKRKKEDKQALLYYKNAFIVYKKLKEKDKAVGVNILENMKELEKRIK